MRQTVRMRALALSLTALAAAAVPAPAQEAGENLDSAPLPFFENWADRTEEMMRELMDEFGPGVEGMMTEMLPRLHALAEQLGGLAHYEWPEVLPNGDIIIRRKPDAPPLPPDMAPDNDPIEL